MAHDSVRCEVPLDWPSFGLFAPSVPAGFNPAEGYESPVRGHVCRSLGSHVLFFGLGLARTRRTS